MYSRKVYISEKDVFPKMIHSQKRMNFQKGCFYKWVYSLQYSKVLRKYEPYSLYCPVHFNPKYAQVNTSKHDSRFIFLKNVTGHFWRKNL